MAQPAVLYMFDKEIKPQSSLDNEKKKKQIKRNELDALYKKQEGWTYCRKTALQNELTGRYDEKFQSKGKFIRETDGTGGSGKSWSERNSNHQEKWIPETRCIIPAINKEIQPKLDSTGAALNLHGKWKKDGWSGIQ